MTDSTATMTRAPARTCSIPGCDGLHQARGWCSKHYLRWLRNGDPMKCRQRGPWHGVGVTSVDLVKQTGATYRQIDYWTRAGYITPMTQGTGSGIYRDFDPSVVPRVKAMLALSKLVIPDTDGPWVIQVGDVRFTIEVDSGGGGRS